MAELALNDDQRQAFARQLDGVRVAELVRRRRSTLAGCGSGGRDRTLRDMGLWSLYRGVVQ